MTTPVHSTPPADPPAWHALTFDETARRLSADPQLGLDDAEAGRRLTAIGPNRLPEKPPEPAWRLFLAQFKSVLVLVLVAAAALAGVIGDTLDMVVILVVVVFNAALGFHQEYRAERILDALKRMLAPHSRVRRGGREARLSSHELVPGDVVLIEAGDRVPADGRIFAAHGLEIDESMLTGESEAVAKDAAVVVAAAAPLAERPGLVYMNTVVTRGRGEMLVTGTGAATEIGRLVHLLQETPESATPLQVKLDQLGKRLALIAGVVVTIILAMGLARGEALSNIVITSIALAVAAIPEGLPAVVTVTLAIGMARMTRHGAIVKRLAAVESLGCTTAICSDKTGTLTVNQMTARALVFAGRRFAVGGEGYDGAGEIVAEDGGPSPDLRALAEPALLCNDSRIRDGQLIGDPTEGALLAFAAKCGCAGEVPALPRIAEIPFDAAHKYMATFHRDGETVWVFVKGAPDVVVPLCDAVRGPDGEAALDEAGRTVLRTEVEALAGRALRVLAVAAGRLPRGLPADGDLKAAVRGLTLRGLIGLMDPPRPEAKAAVASCRRAGIEVRMITGDHAVTAAAVAREVGIGGEVVTGADLDAMDTRTLAARIAVIGVFARVAPEHKVKIVQALKERGHIVAMTGDGVNDAAALKAADIGVAMGRSGTDVAREAATMVLTDDNFATIVNAVREGRTIYDNIVKFLRFQLSTNVGALLTVFTAPLIGLPVPFNAIQILWVNIIMDGPPAMALGFDPTRHGVMSEPPRDPAEPILTRRRLARLVTYGTTMMVGTLGVLAWGLETGTREHALTLAFTTFVLFQFFNVFNARVGTGSAFNRHFFANRHLWLALLAVLALQVVVVYWAPAQAIFRTVPLSAADWGIAFGVAASIVVLDEVRKAVQRLLGLRPAQRRRHSHHADLRPPS